MSGLLDFVYDSEIFVDLYGILEVEIDAKSDEIKQAYIKLAKKNHPDQGGSSDKFQDITRAYEILYNKETRKEYDLYYLDKNDFELRGDETIRLREDFKNFINANDKPISKEELDKLYAETFVEYKDKYKEIRINENELIDRTNDIEIERKNMQIETSDDTLSNFISQHKDTVKVNDLFEFLKFKNAQSFSNSIMTCELGTLDTMPGYVNGYSSFIDENENFGSNLYSNVSDINTTLASENNTNLNIDEFMEWKINKQTQIPLTEDDINNYLKKRKDEQDNIFNEVEKNLESKSKIKELEKFFKEKSYNENIEKYNNNFHNTETLKMSEIPEIINIDESTNSKNTLNHSKSSDIDGMLKFMDEVNSTNKQDFGELEKEIGIDKIKKKSDGLTEIKSIIDYQKSNNVRKKREFK